MYTGGTTGLPKGVLLDHRAEMLNLYHIAMAVDLDPGRVYLHQTPMFHAASMGGILGIPAIGGTSVFLPLFEPAAAMDLIASVPGGLDGHGPDDDLHALGPAEVRSGEAWRRFATSSTAPPRCHQALLERIRATLPGLAALAGLRDDRVFVGPHDAHRQRPPSRAAIVCARRAVQCWG